MIYLTFAWLTWLTWLIRTGDVPAPWATEFPRETRGCRKARPWIVSALLYSRVF